MDNAEDVVSEAHGQQLNAEAKFQVLKKELGVPRHALSTSKQDILSRIAFLEEEKCTVEAFEMTSRTSAKQNF